MLRVLITAVASSLVVGCASAPPPKALGSSEVVFPATITQPAATGADYSLASLPADGLAPMPASSELYAGAPLTLNVPTTALVEEDMDHTGTSYLTAKAGIVMPSESDIDDGYILSGAIGRYFSKLLSAELEAGYIEFDPDMNSADLYAVPIMVNGRVSIPLWILEAYGGGGLGALFYDLEVGRWDKDGWLFAGNAFIGANLALLETLTAGLELKYFVTEEIDAADADLSGLAAMLTFGLRF